MSRACAPISTPGDGTANVLSSKPSRAARSWSTGIGSLPGRVVEEQIGDLLALQASAELVLRELDRGGRLGPVRRHEREDIRIPGPVRGVTATEARRDPRDLVLGHLLGQPI